MNKKILLVSVVAVIAAGFAVQQYRMARRAEAAVSAMERERDELRTRLRAAQSTIGEPDRRPPPPSTEPTNPMPAKSVPVGTRESALPTTAADSLQKAQARLSALRAELRQALANPETLRQAVRKEEESFRALYRLAGFSPGQVEQFRGLLGQSLQRRAALAAQGVAADALEDQLAAEFIVDARALFGEQRGEAIRRYHDTRPFRTVTDRLASSLFYTDTPLNAAQADRLVEVLAQQIGRGPGSIDVGRLDVDATVNQAAAFLSAPQLAEFRVVAADMLALRIVLPGVRPPSRR